MVRPKPISLHPLSRTQKRWRLGMIFAVIAVLIAAWTFTVGYSLAQTIQALRPQVQESLEASTHALLKQRSSWERLKTIPHRIQTLFQNQSTLYAEEDAK